jgi:4'-phosphopantetheinyl transferase
MRSHSDLDTDALVELDGILPSEEVHIWYTELTVPRNGADALLDLLSADERARTSRFQLSGPRSQFLMSRAFLRLALGRYLQVGPREIEFRTTAHGKPELAINSDIRFNLSHCVGAAILAITRDRQVGVDVERIREDVDVKALADRFFSRQESEWLRSLPASDRIPSFFSCWTAKEAYIKARGEGLSLSLSSFGIMPRSDSSKLQLEVDNNPEESRRWSMWQLELGPGLHGALAVEGVNCCVSLGKWPSRARP